jgi:integrase
MRHSEIIALKWDVINFENETILDKVQHTKNRVDIPKTNRSRTIDIIPQLLPYIEKHKQYTYNKSEYVFLNKYGKPYMIYRDFERHCWVHCLKELKIRHRAIMTTRHTFACIMLQNKADYNWISKRMLGQTTTELLRRVYGNYLPANIDKQQFAFLNTVCRK